MFSIALVLPVFKELFSAVKILIYLVKDKAQHNKFSRFTNTVTCTLFLVHSEFSGIDSQSLIV
jgi:hypothetical protein